MENESWLINANALSCEIDGCSFESSYDAEKVLKMIAEAPIVDAVVLPCKIGSEVFNVWQSFDNNGVENFEIDTGKVVSFSIQKDSIWAYCQYENGPNLWHTVEDTFGKTVFLTRKEAEAAIAKMNKGNENA